MSVEARVLNVFNNKTQLSTASQQYLDLRTLPAPPYFAPYQQSNPFFGTGTVALMAQKYQRDWLGIELNPDYLPMAEERLWMALGEAA